jgi:hypothetical protein
MTTTGVLATQIGKQIEAALAGKTEIGEDQVGVAGELERVFCGAGLLDIVAGGLELELDDAAELLFVFNYQDGAAHA